MNTLIMIRKPLQRLAGGAGLWGALAALNSPGDRLNAADYTLQNDQVTFTCSTADDRLLPGSVQDKKTGQVVKLGMDLFSLVLTNATTIHSGEFKLAGTPQLMALPVNPVAARLAEQLPGNELVANLTNSTGDLQVTWHVILRDGSHYLREQVVLTAGAIAFPLKAVGMLETPNVTAHATGTVDGCPVADQTVFYGVEHPLSINRAEMGYVRCFLPRGAAISWPISNANAHIRTGLFYITIPGMTSVTSANMTKRRR